MSDILLISAHFLHMFRLNNHQIAFAFVQKGRDFYFQIYLVLYSVSRCLFICVCVCVVVCVCERRKYFMMGKNFNISRKKLMLFQYGVNCVLLKKKQKTFYLIILTQEIPLFFQRTLFLIK